MRSYPFFAAILVGSSLFGLACGGDVIVEPRVGTLQVSTATSGDNPDADGYTIQLDGGQPQPIGPAAQLTVDLVEGNHTVTLAGVAANCTAAKGSSQSVMVAPRTLAIAQFTVTCSASSGAIKWTTTPLPPSVTAEIGGHSGRSLWGSSLSDLFMIGHVSGAGHRNGIWHFDGAGWTEQVSRVDTVFNGIWGFSGGDVYAVGAGSRGGIPSAPVILHYDGSHWSDMAPPAAANATLSGLWGAQPGDIFAAGHLSIGTPETELLAHFDGGSWSKMTTLDLGDYPVLTDMSGTSGTDVWAVGDREKCLDCENRDAIALHYNGAEWSLSLSAAVLHNDTFTGVWAAAPNDVWVVGYNVEEYAIVYHYDGASWTRGSPLGTSNYRLQDVWAGSSSDVYAVGPAVLLHYDGTAWSKISDVGGDRVWGTSPNDVFVLRQDAILHGER